MALNLGVTNTPLAGIHDYQSLVLGPLLETSKVLQHVRVIKTDASVVHIPTAKAAGTGWYAEHAEIAQVDDLIDELVVTPVKCASLAVISNELAMDTSPGAVSTIGKILVQSVANEVDSAFFDGTGVAPQPLGLGSVVGLSSANGLTMDGVPDAIRAIEDAGGTPSIIWCNPAEWGTFTKAVTDHATVSPLGPLQRSLLGIPVEVTKACPAGTVYVADGTQVVAVVRIDGTVAVSQDAGFTRDQTHIRVVSRIGFGYPFPATIAELTA